MVAVVAILLAILGSGSGAQAAAPQRPNVVVVMTDDQTVRQLDHMPNVEAELAAEGASYERFFVNHPLCCPSRATFLTGQYFHNHRVAGTYRKLHDSKTLPVWLRRAGYATGFAGKYLNGYGGDRPRYVPPGWNEWYAAVGGSTQDVYGYRVNEIGNLVRYGGGTDASSRT